MRYTNLFVGLNLIAVAWVLGSGVVAMIGVAVLLGFGVDVGFAIAAKLSR